MSPITTHILDTSLGKPAANVAVALYYTPDLNQPWQTLGTGSTNADGREPGLLADDFELQSGFYKIKFETGAYFKSLNCQGFYPFVEVPFQIESPEKHYHVPLLLNPFGYSTYRGS
jgi:5-hydroxyisourate hydrolase